MEHKSIIIAVFISAIISSVCTATILNLNTSSTEITSKTIETTLRQLKADLTQETQARLDLQNDIDALTNQRSTQKSHDIRLEATIELNEQTQEEQSPESSLQNSLEQTREQSRKQRRAERLARQQPEYKIQRLTSAGFAQEEASRIIQLESEESLKRLQAQYDFRRQRSNTERQRLANINSLRTELGDQNYERYLNANGWSTSAQIGSVIGNSPGENAGLRAGDKIISYAGERVFNLNEVNNLTIQGDIGESVLIEVDRSGESVQLTIPRGPIGINSGRRGFRR